MIPSRIPQSAGAFVLLIASYLSTSTTVVRAAENAPCYYPGGQPALGFYPCQAFDAPVSSCCPAGWTCFSNRLCVATTNSNSYPNLTLGAVQRGACTNPKWDNEFCGGACLDPDNADGKLAACGDDRFCCADDFNTGKCNCSGDEGSKRALTITPGIAQTIIGVSDTTFVGAPSLSIASTRTSLPTTVATASTSSRTTGAAGSGTATRGQIPSATGSAAPTSTSTGGGGDGGSTGSSNNGRTIGIAVGASIGGVALIGGLILGYFCCWKPRHPSDGGGAGNQQSYNVGGGLELAEDHPIGPSFGHYGGRIGQGDR